MGDNEINSMMKDLDRIYEELNEEKECKIYFLFNHCKNSK